MQDPDFPYDFPLRIPILDPGCRILDKDPIPGYKDLIPGSKDLIPGYNDLIPGYKDPIPGN